MHKNNYLIYIYTDLYNFNILNIPMAIPTYYAGKTIAITGGTGFIGQCLIEKLLRSCPEIKKIILLMRPKRNSTPQERIVNLTELPVSS